MRVSLKKSVLAAGFVVLSASAQAADRVALVIGNAAYKDQPALANPTNDADDVSAMLRKLGFEVIEGLDTDRDAFKDKVHEFDKKLKGGQIALFYYSGHGMQVDGRTFAIPVDAKIANQDDLDSATIDIADILKVMAKKDITSIVVLDACRNNPFSAELARSLKLVTRGGENPFKVAADIKAPSDPFIVYSTDQGNVAQDGDGRNSPFTKAFLKHAPSRGIVIEKVAREIREDVSNATGSKQVPHFAGLPRKDVYLGGEPDATLQTAALSADANPVSAPSAVRLVAMPVPSGALTQDPQSAPKVEPVEDPGAKCDRLTNDVEDPLRDKTLPIVHGLVPVEAIAICEKAVEAKPTFLRYQNELAHAYFDADRFEDALKIFQKAASLGSGYAANQVGYFTYRGLGGLTKDYTKALPWLEKAERLGAQSGGSNAGYIYAHGIGVPKDTAKALEYLNKGVALNHAESMVELAYEYELGLGVPKDMKKAKELLTKAADLENPSAMVGLGDLAGMTADGATPNYDEALRWYIKASSYDAPYAMSALGYLYMEGKGGVQKDPKIAFDWFKRGEKLKDAASLRGLAYLYRDGRGVEKDAFMARTYFERAAALDDSTAMYSLAKMYQSGDFGAVDQAKYISWLEKAAVLDDALARDELEAERKPEAPGETCDRLAAAQTDPLRPKEIKFTVAVERTEKAVAACDAAFKASPKTLRYANQLGRSYLEAEKYTDALKVYTAPALAKSAFATMWVGNFYGRGLGVPQDPKRAFEWYKKAADLGSTDGMFNMASAYRDGTGVPKDLTKAAQQFERGAKLGDVSAMQQLCEAYVWGYGVTQDYVEARDWCEKAAKLGNTDAKFRLGDLYDNGNGIKQDGAAARLWYQQAAADGNLAAKWNLANIYLNGIGGAQDLQKARGLLLEAAGSDNIRAQKLLAQTLLAGVFTKIDADEGRVGGEDEARKWYQKAFAKKDADAQSWLANFAPGAKGDISQGLLCDQSAGSVQNPNYNPEAPPPAKVDTVKGVPACEAAVAASLPLKADDLKGQRYAEQLGLAYYVAGRYFDAARIFKSVAAVGSSYAKTWIGALYERGQGGLLKNSDEAAAWYEKAAETNAPSAMYNLGVYRQDLFLDKVDPDKNGKLAREWFEKAANAGNVDARYQFALSYKRGMGTEVSIEKYIAELKKAADSGSTEALKQMAYYYNNGEFLPKDEVKARAGYQRAVDLGDKTALSSLGVMKVMGTGGPKDLVDGKKLIERAASDGEISALSTMAKGYHYGYFGKVDLAEAKRFYRKAADLGDTESFEKLKEFK